MSRYSHAPNWRRHGSGYRARANFATAPFVDSGNAPWTSAYQQQSKPFYPGTDWNRQTSPIQDSAAQHSSAGFLSPPLLTVTGHGTVTIALDYDVVVEIATDRSVRITCPNKFSVATSGRGSAAAINHSDARIQQDDGNVICQFGADKGALISAEGILFTKKQLNLAYLVSSSSVSGSRGPACLAGDEELFNFGSFSKVADCTVPLFYCRSRVSGAAVGECQQWIRRAHYENRANRRCQVVKLGGVFVQQDAGGKVTINCKPRFMEVNPTDGTVHIRTNFVDMGVETNGRYFVKRGVKRVHVSNSGMVVSDGNREKIVNIVKQSIQK